MRTPIGDVPTRESIDVSGLDLPPGALEAALAVRKEEWLPELDEMAKFFKMFGDRLPPQLWTEHERLRHRLESGLS